MPGWAGGMFWSRRNRPLFDDTEHEAAEREARGQAELHALLVELWGPMEPPERIVLVKLARPLTPKPRKKDARMPLGRVE